jgi:hypothetical protein
MDNTCRSDKLRACPCLPCHTEDRTRTWNPVHSSSHNNIKEDEEEGMTMTMKRKEKKKKKKAAYPVDNTIPRDNTSAQPNLHQSVETRHTLTFDPLFEIPV